MQTTHRRLLRLLSLVLLTTTPCVAARAAIVNLLSIADEPVPPGYSVGAPGTPLAFANPGAATIVITEGANSPVPQPQLPLELTTGTGLIKEGEQVGRPAAHGHRALWLRAEHRYRMALWLMAGSGDDEITGHCPILVATTEHLARLEKQGVFGMVLQPHPLSDAGLGDDHSTRRASLLQADELHRRRN